MKRKVGFYWVKSKFSFNHIQKMKSEWVIAKYRGGDIWFYKGGVYNDKDFLEIDERQNKRDNN